MIILVIVKWNIFVIELFGSLIILNRRGCIYMARCAICDKSTVFGNNVSHSIRRTSRKWKPNIRKVRAIVDGEHKTISVCTRCLRSNKVVRNI